MIAEALKEAREIKGFSQEEVGQLTFLSSKTISAYERGKRNPNDEIVAKIAQELNHPRLYMQAAYSVTGGVFCSPWLDGESVDLHRTSVWAKSIEELEEAKEAISKCNVINVPSKVTKEIQDIMYESLLQSLDARVAIDHYVAVMCQEYGFSIQKVFKDHENKLKNKEYVRG